MKVVLSDQTIIECTIDELEELVARGIVGNQLNVMKDSLGIDVKPAPKWPSTPKMPTPWTDVVAVYGCVTPNHTADDLRLRYDQSAFKTAVDCIQKVDGTVLINEKKEET